MHVVRLGLTAVKGMAHLALPEVELSAAGPAGDRIFCVVDASTGRVLRTVEDDTAMACQASWQPPTLAIRTPCGAAVGEPADAAPLTGRYWDRDVELVAVDGPWSALLTRHFGRAVRLCRVVAPGGVVWSGAVSVVTTSSLAEVARRVGRDGDDGARFRATVVVDTTTAAPFVEDGWVGRRLRLGAVSVVVTGRTPRCAVVDRRPGLGGQDASVLAALSRDRADGGEITFGVHGHVEKPGWVFAGDPVVCGDVGKTRSYASTWAP